MKTFKKFMVMLFAGIMAFGSYLAYPLTKLVAYVSAQAQQNLTVKVKDVPSTLNMEENSSVLIPFDESYFTNVDSGVKTVRIYNGMNRVEKEYDAESTDFNFTPRSAGTYQIVYGYVENDEFHRISSNYTLVVIGATNSFTFAENSEFYLPSKVPAKNGQKVVIPYPTVVLSDGTKLNYGDEGYNVILNVNNKNGEIALIQGDGYQYIELTEESALGIYDVKYTYNETILHKNFEVVNKDNFDTSKLSYNVTITDWNANTTRYKGEEITLPTVTVKDSNSNDVTSQTFNKIEVEYLVNGTVQTNTDNSLFELNGNKLILKQDAKTDNTEYYRIKYNITDYFGNVVKKDYTFNISNVDSYRNAPVVYAVRAYNDETAKEDIMSMAYAIPSTYNFIEEERDTITIPAIYAEDIYGSEEFTYERTIRYVGESSKNIDANANEQTTFKVEKTGKLVLSFKATSKLTGKSYAREFDIIVVDGKEGSTDKVVSKPEIKLPEIPSVMIAGEKVDIAYPVVRDKDSSNSIIDERVRLEVENLEEVVVDHDVVGYKLTAPENATSITVRFTATNDNGETASVEKVVNIIPTDETPAEAEVIADYTVDNDTSVVTLPTVKFTDENITYTDISVSVYDPNGKAVTGIQNVIIRNGQVSGGEFTASLSGDYKVIYTAIDPYSNATSILVVIQSVSGSTGYIQSGISTTFPTHAEPNETITLPEAIIQNNGEVVNNVEYSIQVIKSSGFFRYNEGTRKFTATEEGQYVFAYFIGDKQVSNEYTLTVSDTVKPELNIDNATRPSTVVDYVEDNPQSINIPAFKPSDANGIADYGVTITKDGATFKKYSATELIEEFYKNGETLTYAFTPKGEGVYVVEYYATDNAGNKTTYKLDSINVGDVDTPKIVFNVEIPTTVDKNETVSFKKSDIVIDDYSADEASYEVVVTGPDSKSVENTGADGNYAYKLATSGEYTMTITAKDGHGHSVSEVKTITVTTEEYKSKINTDVLGIVITIISLLILAGVIFYFIKTRDKKSKKQLPENKDDTKKD